MEDGLEVDQEGDGRSVEAVMVVKDHVKFLVSAGKLSLRRGMDFQ